MRSLDRQPKELPSKALGSGSRSVLLQNWVLRMQPVLLLLSSSQQCCSLPVLLKVIFLVNI